MGEVTLKIGADVQGALDGTEKLNKSVDELNKDTEQYNKRATTGFNQTGQAATNASQGVSKAAQAFKLLGGVVASPFSVAAIVQWGKVILTSTGAGADAIARFQSALQTAFERLNIAIATTDFSNLLQGLQNAWQEGKRYADVLDEIQARQVALGAFKATLETQQAEQRLIARNAQNSVEVRMAAIDKIIELEKQKLSETLDLQNTELDSALQNAAILQGIDAENADKLKERKDLILQIASAYGSASGTDTLNAELEAADNLKASLDALITTTQLYSGDQIQTVKNYDDYNKALKNLTPEENRLLDLRRTNIALSDDDRDRVNQLRTSRQQSTTEVVEQESSLQRLRNSLITELIGENKKAEKSADELAEAMKKAWADFNLSLTKTIVESDKELEKFIEDLESLSDLKVEIPDPEPSTELEQSMKNYEMVLDLAKQTTEGQRNEINKQIAALEEWSKTGVITAAQYEEALKKLQDQLKQITTFSEKHPLAAAFGIENEEQLQQIKDFVGQLANFANEIVNQQVEATTRIVEDQNQRIEEQEELVNREFELKKEGLANNFAVEQENLQKMQKARDNAIKDREKAIKIQKAMSTVESGVALVSAAANIIKGFSGIPIVGVALGLAAVGAMIAGFIVSQSKVKDAVQFAEGGLLTGKKHSQGGIRIPGTNIEVEGDEFVTNRRSTAKYLPLLEAINKDDRDGMRLFFDRKFINRMPQQKFYDIDKSKKLGEIARNTRRNGKDIQYGPGYIIERDGGYTKKINLN